MPSRVRWRQRARKCHRWLAILAGIPIALLTITGLILVWEPELRLFEERKAAIVEVPESGPSGRIPYQELLTRLEGSSGARAELILLPEKAHHAAVFRTEDDHYHFVDPYTGELRKTTDLPAPIMAAIRVLHTSFFLGRFGTWIGIIASLAFCLLSATGLYLFFKRCGPMKKRLEVHFDKGPVRRNYELHAVVGFWSAGLLALISLSGALIGIGDPWRNFILGVTGSEFAVRPKLQPSDYPSAPHLKVDQLIGYLNTHAPEGLIATSVLLPTSPDKPLAVRYVYFWANRPASWGFIDPRDGHILDFHHFPEFEAGHLIHRLNRGFHSGELFTAGMRWLWFLTMLAGILILVTGYRFIRPSSKRLRKNA